MLDPFLGSGTTAVAAVQTRRHYVGYEVSVEYCELAEQRIAEARAKLRTEDWLAGGGNEAPSGSEDGRNAEG